jgi:hypothetical protein
MGWKNFFSLQKRKEETGNDIWKTILIDFAVGYHALDLRLGIAVSATEYIDVGGP